MRGDELTPWLIRYAYSEGAFPMTMDDGSVEWFQPVTRALFPIEGIHVSRSLRRVLRASGLISTPQPPSSLTNQSGEGGSKPLFAISFDTAFEEVMRGCLRPAENWISEDFVRVYTQIHLEGWAHSVEVWSLDSRPQQPDEGDALAVSCSAVEAAGGAFVDSASTLAPVRPSRAGKGRSAKASHGPTPQYPDTPIPASRLVGGLYGIALGSCFCAESMFHRQTNASKVALWAMVEKCRSLGFTIFDAQVMNPHLESLGACPVRHEKYMTMLRRAIATSTPWS